MTLPSGRRMRPTAWSSWSMFGDGGADLVPGRLLGIDRLAVGDDLADMRLLAQPGRREPPDIGEDGIEEAEPARPCRTRRPPRPDGRASRPAAADSAFEAAFQRDLLGDVLVDVVMPPSAFGMATTRSVRPSGRCHMSSRGCGLLVGGEVPRAPVAVVRLLRQFPLGAELVEDGAFLRARWRATRRQVPDRAEGGVVEEDAAVAAEHRHAGGQMVERAGVGFASACCNSLAHRLRPRRRRSRRRPCRPRSACRAPQSCRRVAGDDGRGAVVERAAPERSTSRIASRVRDRQQLDAGGQRPPRGSPPPRPCT